MDIAQHTMPELFAQLGLPNAPADIAAFVRAHRPLPMTTRLPDAPFWSASQASLIREKLQEDGDWSLLVDTLNAQLRAHPDVADMPQGDADHASSPCEGHIGAARRYDAAAAAFATSGQVAPAARAAQPHDLREAQALRDAERAGLAKAKG